MELSESLASVPSEPEAQHRSSEYARVGVGSSGARACGVSLKLRLELDPRSALVTKVAVTTSGRAASAATDAVMNQLLLGRSSAELEHLTHSDIVRALGEGCGRGRRCAVLVHDALIAALADLRGESAAAIRAQGAVTCRCFLVHEGTIRRAVRMNGLSKLHDVSDYTSAGSACGCCHREIEAVLSAERETAAANCQ